MKRELTTKQQAKVRAKVFKLLLALGFQYDETGSYYWRKVHDRSDQRVCVGFDVFETFGQHRNGCWTWMNTKLNEAPAFGYSGTTTLGPQFGTVERVIDTTLEQFWTAGISHSSAYNQAKVTQAKDKLTAALTLVRDAL